MEGKIVFLISTNVFCLFRFFKVVKITANLGEPKQQFFLIIGVVVITLLIIVINYN